MAVVHAAVRLALVLDGPQEEVGQAQREDHRRRQAQDDEERRVGPVAGLVGLLPQELGVVALERVAAERRERVERDRRLLHVDEREDRRRGPRRARAVGAVVVVQRRVDAAGPQPARADVAGDVVDDGPEVDDEADDDDAELGDDGPRERPADDAARLQDVDVEERDVEQDLVVAEVRGRVRVVEAADDRQELEEVGHDVERREDLQEVLVPTTRATFRRAPARTLSKRRTRCRSPRRRRTCSRSPCRRRPRPGRARCPARRTTRAAEGTKIGFPSASVFLPAGDAPRARASRRPRALGGTGTGKRHPWGSDVGGGEASPRRGRTSRGRLPRRTPSSAASGANLLRQRPPPAEGPRRREPESPREAERSRPARGGEGRPGPPSSATDAQWRRATAFSRSSPSS